MKYFILLALFSFSLLANPTPVLDCQYEDEEVTARVQVMNSSSPWDVFSKFQTHYYYTNKDSGLFISKLVRYDEMFNRFDEAGKYVFSSKYMAMSLEFNSKSMKGFLRGPLCDYEHYINLCLDEEMSKNINCLDVCLSQVDYTDLECKSFVDVDQLNFHPWSDYRVSL